MEELVLFHADFPDAWNQHNRLTVFLSMRMAVEG